MTAADDGTVEAFASCHPMPHTLEISDDMKERLDSHCEDGESYEEFLEELLTIYETEGAFLREGYSE